MDFTKSSFDIACQLIGILLFSFLGCTALRPAAQLFKDDYGVL
jgi:hypothetical protein